MLWNEKAVRKGILDALKKRLSCMKESKESCAMHAFSFFFNESKDCGVEMKTKTIIMLEN